MTGNYFRVHPTNTKNQSNQNEPASFDALVLLAERVIFPKSRPQKKDFSIDEEMNRVKKRNGVTLYLLDNYTVRLAHQQKESIAYNNSRFSRRRVPKSQTLVTKESRHWPLTFPFLKNRSRTRTKEAMSVPEEDTTTLVRNRSYRMHLPGVGLRREAKISRSLVVCWRRPKICVANIR